MCPFVSNMLELGHRIFNENMNILNHFCDNVIGMFKHLSCKPKSSNIMSLNTNLKCFYNMD